MIAQYVIVGSGLTGAVVARMLADAGKKVVVVERRSHVGGNVHDHHHISGIRIHTYGPHYFRCNSGEIWSFLNRFTEFYPFEAVVKTRVDGQLENWPIAASYIRSRLGSAPIELTSESASNFEEASLKMMPRVIYEKFVRGYSEKQWGVPATRLESTLARRFDVRQDDDPRLTPAYRYQGLPVQGYTAMFDKMLHGIPVLMNFDYLKHREDFAFTERLVVTGPIDEFFGFDLGRLGYRGQQRTHRYFGDRTFMQPCGQINNPSPEDGPHIRTLEWKHFMPDAYASQIRGTVLTTEVPCTPTSPDGFEYPFPSLENAQLYQRYRERAKTVPRTIFCGRLGEYRYLDMDQAIGRAMAIAKHLLNPSQYCAAA